MLLRSPYNYITTLTYHVNGNVLDDSSAMLLFEGDHMLVVFGDLLGQNFLQVGGFVGGVRSSLGQWGGSLK